MKHILLLLGAFLVISATSAIADEAATDHELVLILEELLIEAETRGDDGALMSLVDMHKQCKCPSKNTQAQVKLIDKSGRTGTITTATINKIHTNGLKIASVRFPNACAGNTSNQCANFSCPVEVLDAQGIAKNALATCEFN